LCCGWLLAIACLSPASAAAGELFVRMYGYLPQVYGYPPSAYVFPRYGFERGYVYVQRPPYGSPALGTPAMCPGEPQPPTDFSPPGAQFEPVELGSRVKRGQSQGQSPAAKPVAARASSRVE
jgi:hypothetical protein